MYKRHSGREGSIQRRIAILAVALLVVAVLAYLALGGGESATTQSSTQQNLGNIESTTPLGTGNSGGEANQAGSENPVGGQSVTLENPTYHNLYTTPIQNEVEGLLLDYGISQGAVDWYFNLVDNYNYRLHDVAALSLGTEMVDLTVDYSDVYTETAEYYETNCRLAAYVLVGDFITTQGDGDGLDTFLMFDMAAITSDGKYDLTEGQAEDYANLYASVSVAGETELAGHVAAIEAHLAQVSATYDLPEGVHLITAYLHSTYDDLRFVGHAGVMIEAGEEIVFMEKYGPSSPFQMTTFSTVQQLLGYMNSRSDFYGDPEELEPIYFDNGKFMG